MQSADLIEILLAVSDSRKTEDRPSRIVRMACHLDTNLFTYRNDRIKEILIVSAKIICCDILILF